MRSALSAARLTSLLGVFLAVSVLMGIVGAGILAPVVGASGLAAREGVGMFDRLPGDLEQNPLAQQSKILTADGKILATPAQQNRIIVDSEQISKHMKNAQVAIEDERFFQHGGMDLQALARAMVSNATSDSTQGGSTLTQQYIKLALQEEALKNEDADALQAATARTGMEGYVRKLRELKYAITLEERTSKDEILTGYLNLAFYGDNAYGVEAAAKHYFNTKAKDLTIEQAALLAGIVRSPTNTNPVANPEAAKARRNIVLDKMHAQGMITDAEWKKAKKSKITLDLTDSQQSCLNSSHPYFCDYVTNWLLDNKALGDTVEERLEKLTTGGLTITTTLDRDLSKKLGEITAKGTPRGNDYLLGSAAAVVQPGTGKVLAFNQSSTYSLQESGDRVAKTSVNWSVDYKYGGSGGFEIGSVAKAFTVVRALQEGRPIDSKVEIRSPGLVDSEGNWVNNPNAPLTPKGETYPAGIFFAKDFDAKCGLGQPYWGIRNALNENHETSQEFRKITALSVNTGFATLASELGTCSIRDLMGTMGLHTGTGEAYGQFAPEIILGNAPASPLTVASAYATIASGGVYCEPVPVTKIVDANGKEIPFDQPGCERVIDEEVALGTVELLKGVVSMEGSGWRAILDGDRPAGGKTGTNNDSTQTWFAGFTPQLSTAVFVGNPANRYDGDMKDIVLGGKKYDDYLFGSTLAAPMWKEFMDYALRDQPKEDWEKPSKDILEGKQVRVPDVVGKTEAEAKKILSKAKLTSTTQLLSSLQPEGTVLYVSPGVGSSVKSGSSVVLGVSNGQAPVQQTVPQPQQQATQPSQPQQPSAPAQTSEDKAEPTRSASPSPTTSATPTPSATPTQAPRPTAPARPTVTVPVPTVPTSTD